MTDKLSTEERAALVQRIADLEHELEQENRGLRMLILNRKLATAERQRDELAEALRTYGRHSFGSNCSPTECECGFDAALAALREPTEGEA